MILKIKSIMSFFIEYMIIDSIYIGIDNGNGCIKVLFSKGLIIKIKFLIYYLSNE